MSADDDTLMAQRPIITLLTDFGTADYFVAALEIEILGRTVGKLHRCYADAASTPDEVFAIWGSAGFLELSAYCDSAARRLGASRSDLARVRLSA